MGGRDFVFVEIGLYKGCSDIIRTWKWDMELRVRSLVCVCLCFSNL